MFNKLIVQVGVEGRPAALGASICVHASPIRGECIDCSRACEGEAMRRSSLKGVVVELGAIGRQIPPGLLEDVVDNKRVTEVAKTLIRSL
jgi:hypothetical protein